MKIVIIIALYIIAYFLIGFGVLVLRARTHNIDLEDTAIALLCWPVVGMVYICYYAMDRIRSNAQRLGKKLGRMMKK